MSGSELNTSLGIEEAHENMNAFIAVLSLALRLAGEYEVHSGSDAYNVLLPLINNICSAQEQG